MSGETEQQVSGWTVDTLRSHLLAKFDEKDLRDEQRFQAQQDAIQQALDAAEKAVAKAETATEKRFDSVNEFREQLSDQAVTFMPRKEAQVLIDAQNEKVGSLETRITNLGLSIERIVAAQTGAISERHEGRERSVSIQAFIGTVIGVVLFVLTVAGLIVGFAK